MTELPKVELVPVEADSGTQRVSERLIEALENQCLKIYQYRKWVLAPAKTFECVWVEQFVGSM